MTYFIFTEDSPEYMANVRKLASNHFDGFTIIPSLGYWKGVPEQSMCIVITGAEPLTIQTLAKEIKDANNQQAVMVLTLPAIADFV